MKERSIKELLQLMLDNQHCFDEGLCKWASKLYPVRIITLTEFFILLNYIRDNRPSMFSSFEGFKWSFSRRYYWKPGNIVQRIKWLQYHIKKNS
jgi:hypothetical protein